MERRYWWVNQNQTYQQEVKGHYLWSPKHKSDGSRNPYYEFMREVAPGDVVFSFADTRIKAIGFAKSYAYECPKPIEFGSTGRNWDNIGWKVDVHFQEISTPIRPKEHIKLLVPFLPDKYSPIQNNGDGIQSVYLTALPKQLADTLITLMEPVIQKAIYESPAGLYSEKMLEKKPDVLEWEDHEERLISENDISETEKSRLINARHGQGAFRIKVQQIERSCRITKVDNPIHLIASHIKPWRDSENNERLDGENGLLLTPSIDHLFDKGFITFEKDGYLLVSPRADTVSLKKMGIPVEEKYHAGDFSDGQKHYLQYHRKEIFLQAS